MKLKKYLGFILSLVMLVSVVAVPASAEATMIDEVDVFVYYPVAGQEAVFDIYEIPYYKPYGLMNGTPNGNVLWYDETDGFYLKAGDRFEADHDYRVEVNLEADFPEYTFPLCQDPDSGEYYYEINAYINGWYAETTPVGKNITDLTRLKTIKISHTMTADDNLMYIDSVYIDNVPVPQVGNHPIYAGIEIEGGYAGDGYRFADLRDENHLNGIGWYDLTDKLYMSRPNGKFKEGHEYELRVLLEADPAHYFVTDDGLPNVSSYVRDNPATSSWLNGYDPERYLYVTYKFGKAVKSSDIIETVTITDLDIPKVGNIADYSVTLGGSNYHLSSAMDEFTRNGITWYSEALDGPIKVNDPFEESKSYGVILELYCDKDTTFLTDDYGEPLVQVTVNGRQAYCYSIGERKIGVAFAFNSDEKYAYTVSGIVTSFGSADDEVTVQLCPAGYINPVHEDKAFGFNTPFAMTDVADGQYTMTVHKKNHKAYVQGIVVSRADVSDIFVVLDLSGDANTDRVVNLSDVTVILKYIAKWDVELNTYVCDVNNDGAVNLADVTQMLKYIAKWDVELK